MTNPKEKKVSEFDKGYIAGIELCEEVVKEALQDREMAKDPNDPEIRANWLLTEFDTYKSTYFKKHKP